MDPELQRFINAVGESYEHFERDRLLIERSMAMSSEEMRELNTKLKKNHRIIALHSRN